MEHYTVFIVTLKEILSKWKPWMLSFTLIGAILAWRLPDIINAVRQ